MAATFSERESASEEVADAISDPTSGFLSGAVFARGAAAGSFVSWVLGNFGEEAELLEFLHANDEGDWEVWDYHHVQFPSDCPALVPVLVSFRANGQPKPCPCDGQGLLGVAHLDGMLLRVLEEVRA